MLVTPQKCGRKGLVKIRSSLAALMTVNVNAVRAVMSFIISPEQYAVMEAVMAQMLVIGGG